MEHDPMFSAEDSRKLNELHKEVFGNGHPESSIKVRLGSVEQTTRAVRKMGAWVLAALGVLILEVGATALFWVMGQMQQTP